MRAEIADGWGRNSRPCELFRVQLHWNNNSIPKGGRHARRTVENTLTCEVTAADERSRPRPGRNRHHPRRADSKGRAGQSAAPCRHRLPALARIPPPHEGPHG